MSLVDQTVPLEEVAAALGRDPAWLRRHWLRLSRMENFPRRLPSSWRWPRAAVEAWLAAGGTGRAQLPANDDPGGAAAAWRAELDRRYRRER